MIGIAVSGKCGRVGSNVDMGSSIGDGSGGEREFLMIWQDSLLIGMIRNGWLWSYRGWWRRSEASMATFGAKRFLKRLSQREPISR